MVKKGFDTGRLGKSNRKLTIDLLRREECTTRRDLAALSGLDPSTITKIIRDFLEKGYCKELSTEDTGSIGRKATILKLNQSALKSVVLKIGVEVTEIGIGYFDGHVEIVKKMTTTSQFPKYIREMEKVAKDFLKTFPLEQFMGFSISVPGMVDTENSFIIDVPHLGWRELQVKDFTKTKFPIYIDNEANLSLIAEKWKNPLLKDYNDLLFVYISEGIGCGLMIDGKLYKGRTFSAGEFGHMTIETNGPRCFCGKKGCWETLTSTEARVKKFESTGQLLKGKNYNEKFVNLIELSKTNNLALKNLREEEEYLATGIINIINGLAPEAVLIGGTGSSLSEDSIKRIELSVNRRGLFAVRNKTKILRSTLDTEGNKDSAVIGAALMAVDRKLDDVI